MTHDPKLDTHWALVRMMQARQRDNLLIVRTGKASMHTQWAKKPSGDRNWDLLISHFGKGEPQCPDAEMIVKQGAFKYSAASRLFKDIPWLRDYRAVALFDDDVLTSWQDINRLFEIFHKFDLDLAQPSLTLDSYWYHPVTVNRPDCFLHFTNFIEPMLPVFSQKALAICLPTFEKSVTSWGLDWVWPHLLGNRRNKVAIIDAVAMRHARPLGMGIKGDLYEQGRALNVDFTEEIAFHTKPLNVDLTKTDMLDLSVEYGRITLAPQPAASAKAADPRIFLYKCRHSIMSMLNVPVWTSIRRDWTMSRPWQGGAAAPHVTSQFFAHDFVMSAGLVLEMKQAPERNAWLEVLQIGESRDWARLILFAHSDEDGFFRLTAKIFGNAGSFTVTTPSMLTGQPVEIIFTMARKAGLVRIQIGNHWTKDFQFAPWAWIGTSIIWAGSKRLQATIRELWIGQLLPGYGEAIKAVHDKMPQAKAMLLQKLNRWFTAITKKSL